MSSRRLQVVLELDTGRYSGRLNAAGTQLKVFSGEVTSSSTSVQRLERSFNTLSNRMSTPIQKLRDYVLILSNIRLAILNVRDIGVAWVGSLLKQSAEVERLTVLMRGLSTATTDVGKNREAEENLTRLFSLARNTGFAVKELADAFVKMKSAGVDPLDGSLESLTNSVAYFGGNSDTFHRASIAIQQMAGKGVISMEELRQQLGEAVPTAMFDMARAAGMSMPQFVKLVSKGAIQAKPALELMFREFDRMYDGSGKRMAETMIGQIAAFKTNLTQLSTSFSGMAAGQTDTLKGYMEQQEQLLKEGKITVQEFERTTAGIEGGGGLFSGAKEALKEVNAAMQSNEAKVALAELGQTINSVLQGLISVGRFVVEWRNVFIGAAKGITIALAGITAVRLGAWLMQLGKVGLASLSAIANTAEPLPGLLGRAETATRSWAAAKQQALAAHNATVAALGREAQSMTGLFASTQRRIAQLMQERVALQARAQALAIQQQQEAASLRTAQTLHAANIAQGIDATRSANMVRTASSRLNAVRNESKIVADRLAATEARLNLAHRQSAGAAVAATVATGRFNATAAASTLAMRAGAIAARGAAAAVTFLGRAMNMALGPIGMIALALYAAADAAGWFENKADRAAAAAARMMQGIADAESMKDVIDRKKRNQKEFTRVSDEINSGVETIDGGTFHTTRKISPERRAELMKRRQELAAENSKLDLALERGRFAINTDSANQNWGVLKDKMDTKSRAEGSDYAARVRAIENNKALSQADKTKQIDALGAQVDAAKITRADAALNSLLASRERLKAAGGDTSILDGMIESAQDYRKSLDSASGSTEELRKQMVGVGNGGNGPKKKLTDAEKAAKKAAKEFDNAREKYDRLIDSQKGEIASLEEQLAGGDKKGTAKFEALKEAGFYADATNKELEEMAKNFARIDELNEQISYEKSLGSLNKAMSKTATEATELWKALRSGSYDTFTRDAQIRSQFADLLDGVTDPKRIDEINSKIDQVVGNIKRADAAEVANNWQRMAEEIENGLLSENEARQRNFELEVERQRKLIDWAHLTAQERIEAEENFQRWKTAREQQLLRENESGIIKMSRDWAKLGTNIDGVFTDAAKSMVDMLAEGEVNIGDFATSVIKALFKVILQAIIAYAILSAIGGASNPGKFSDFMRNGLKNFAGGFAPQAAPTKHTGGMIGGPSSAMAMVGAHLWSNAQTRHNGGWIGGRSLKRGEVPIVGLEKELVLTEDQQRLLGQQISGRSGAGGAPSVNVNIINNSGTDVKAEHGEPEWNGKEYVLSIVMEAASKQGPFRDMLQSTGKK